MITAKNPTAINTTCVLEEMLMFDVVFITFDLKGLEFCASVVTSSAHIKSNRQI